MSLVRAEGESGTPLRMLLVEDLDADASMVVHELSQGGYEVAFERVSRPQSMSAALERASWDVVVSDSDLCHFSARDALALARGRLFDIPFIVVSASPGGPSAAEALAAGASAIVDRGALSLLVPAIERELRAASQLGKGSRLGPRLLHADRLASLGTLSASVAHEINNPLAVLAANIDTAARDVSGLVLGCHACRASRDGPCNGTCSAALAGGFGSRLGEVQGMLTDAVDSIVRVRSIVQDLKLFSRAEGDETGSVDVRRVLEASVRLASSELSHRARVVKDYGEVSPVRGNETRLGQVFLNLIVNAAQALPDGMVGANEIRIVARQERSERVVVEIHDTGAGIPESHIERIFEPFFTTKPPGIGTGLGLAVCRQLVTAMGGEIRVESRVGKGTVFRTSLPAAPRQE